MSYEELVERFAAKYGIDGLAAENGVAAMVIDGVKVELISDEEAGCAVIYAEIGYPPPDANGRFGEMMLKANHLFIGTNGGTLCQNPETDAYVLMRPVPLARLEGEEAFGAILEETLAQVERWQKILGGLREAENTLDSRTTSENAAFDLSAFLQV